MSKDPWWCKQFAEAAKEISRNESSFRNSKLQNFNEHDRAVEIYTELCRGYGFTHLTFMDFVEIGDSLLNHDKRDGSVGRSYD